jgi:exodeoxyribonuclease-5
VNDILFLCATSRLVQTLRRQLPARGDVWRTPTTLTVGQWLTALGEEALLSGVAELPQPLDAFAEGVLWEKVIADSLDEGAAALFDLAGMAAAAAEALALQRQWGLPAGGDNLSDEARLFLRWRAEFLRRCRQGGWLDQSGWHEQVIGLIEAGHFHLPGEIRVAGFDRPTPLEKRLFAALSARGTALEICPPGAVDRRILQNEVISVEIGSARVVSLPDGDAECVAVAAWAAAKLAANPDCRLGIVAPDLAGVRERLENLLDDALSPAAIRPDAGEWPRPFNFSLGRSLAEQPLVRVALDLLALVGSGRAKIEQARLSQLLLAGGWSAAESEADGRARLDAAMRRDLPYFTNLNALLRLAERLGAKAPLLCQHSVTALSALQEVAADGPRKRLPAQWAAHFRQCLRAVAWPGERPLSSQEFQARRAFAEVLDQFSGLDALLGPQNMVEAVRRLGQLCRQRLFQPETRGQPSIQVLGMLESAGLGFDALWVMGMNDDLWPPPPRPNPLLPAETLRAAGAARASAEVELDFSLRVHARLLRAAPEITFSWAQADGNRVLRRSPLVAGLPVGEMPVAELPTLAARLAQEAGSAIEAIDDAQAPPVADGEKVSGGSWLLRAQAICPAWAFYQFRLGAEAMEEAVEGLDPAARGTLVHEALEAFWGEISGSAALAALDEAALTAAVERAVATAITHYEQKNHVSLPARFRQLEGARLQRLLLVWLEVEAKRALAFAVIAREAPAQVEIEGIRVHMVVDRIDQLADGRQIIIDYKTGAAIDVKNWAGQRITEPQLPIYVALVNDEVAAVVFAKVLLDKPAFAGVAEEKDLLPGVQGLGDDKQKIFPPADFPDWIAVVTHWRERLHAIAREVKEGVAGVSIADEKALRYCDVLPLLRLPERRRLLAALDTAGSAPADKS